jgi:dihydrodipicolinate synthase/N-acetylneuraminate lyase
VSGILKKIVEIVFVVITVGLVIYTVSFFTGCSTSSRPAGTYTAAIILDHQRQIMELEQRNASLAERLDGFQGVVDTAVSSLANLGLRAGTMGTSIFDIIYLFDLYQYAVEQLYFDFRNLQRQVAETE